MPSDHECPWPGCTKRVKRELWGCAPHWWKLPEELRERLWASYRGDDLTAHAEALGAIDRWLEENVQEDQQRIRKARTP